MEALKKNRDFQLVFKRGRSFAGRHMVVFVLKNDGGLSRLGISASKKVGHAVLRNRVRRRLKEAYRAIGAGVLAGHDIVILPRAQAAEVDFADLKEQLEYLLRKHEVMGMG